MFSAISSISFFKVSPDKQLSMESLKYVFTKIAENPKSGFGEMVIKFQNNYRKFGKHSAKIYKNSAEN